MSSVTGVSALKVKAVLFDLGNTLVKAWLPEVVFQRVLVSLGISRSVEDIKEALMKTEEDFQNLNYRSMYGKVSYEEYWNKWDSFVLKHLGLTGNDRIVRRIQARWFEHVDCEIYSDVKDTLSKLKRMGLKIGLISTGYEEDINAIFDKVNLQKELFDVIVGANTIKKEKPHPDVFRYALKKLNVSSQETVFIGDNIDADYRGAEKVGIKAILIARTEKRLRITST